MKWQKVRLGDIADSIQPGPFGSQLHSSDYSESGTPIIMPKDMINGKISHADLLYVSKEHVRRLKRHQVHEGNIMVARKGDVRKCVFITDNEDGWMTGSDCLKVALNDSVCFTKFIYYQLRSPFIGKWLETISIGATMPSLNTGLLSGIQLVLPPYATQKRISDILSAYDDLIENNQKQIKLLEEAAQRLYKEWFVDLRFPGYEDTPIVDGVPEGWKIVPIKEMISYEIGGGWGKEEPTGQCEEGAYVIRGTDLFGIANGELLSVPYRYHTMSNLLARKLSDGDIIFEVSGGSRTEGVARTAFITKQMLDRWSAPVICASFCKLIRPREQYAIYLFNHLRYLRTSGKTEEYDKRSASSIVNYRWKDFLTQEFILIPTDEVISQYDRIARAFYSKIVLCSLQIETAKQTRDSLLPKLMHEDMEGVLK